MTPETRERIQQQVEASPVVLFMKGTRTAPQCGFSATVIGILDELNTDYATVNVLEDGEVRQAIKEFSDWPTIPQLYIKGEFVGGCDIVKEMYGNGELQTALGVELPEVATPSMSISDTAARALTDALQGGDEIVRLEISARHQYGLSIGPVNPQDIVVENNGCRIALDRASARRADGVEIDYAEGADGPAFRITNPNGPPQVKTMSVQALKAALGSGQSLELFDTRTPAERDQALIEGSRLLDAEAQKYIQTLPKETPLVFVCHHGQRSRQAADFFLNLGFRNVSNVEGGIDAWSTHIDSNVPRY